MTKIAVYDDDAKRISKICEEYDIPEFELVMALLDIVESDEIKLSEWI